MLISDWSSDVCSSDLRVRAITGCITALPLEPERNTAARALQAMIAALDLDYGFALDIDKGIALGSGMGGSAASAVDRKSGAEGKSVSVRLDSGGRRAIKKTNSRSASTRTKYTT